MSTACSHLFGIAPGLLSSGAGGETRYNYADLLKEQFEPSEPEPDLLDEILADEWLFIDDESEEE